MSIGSFIVWAYFDIPVYTSSVYKIKFIMQRNANNSGVSMQMTEDVRH